MPQITETFTVARPPAVVWAYLQDIPAVVTCLPGLELLESPQENVYRGRLKVRLGAVSAGFEGEARIVASDPAAFECRLQGKGVDRKGGSRANAEFAYSLFAVAGGTQVTVNADINLTGPLAQMGRTGILNDVAHEMTGEFARNLEARLAAQPATTTEAAMAAKASTTVPAELSLWRVFQAILRGRLRALVARLKRSA